MLDNHIKHIHCIGVGGIGVSALAEMLLSHGYYVTGSDLAANQQTKRLAELGIKISIGHKAENITNPDWVVFSSAISADNPELIASKKNNIPFMPRGELLAKLLSQYQVITVAGTHGKTTTTGLIAHLFTTANLDPSYVIGGILKNHASPFHLGKSEYCIAEADESDASFLYMQPYYAVITNIDADHLETYNDSFAELKQSFLKHVAKIPSRGCAVVCIDDPVVRSLIPQFKCRVITYGFSEHADVRACFFQQEGTNCKFSVRLREDDSCLQVCLNLPGQHNVLNALASIALAKEVGVADSAIVEAMSTFPGVGRRFHSHGRMQLAKGNALVFEDYGHHPREIKATVEAAKMAWPDRRVVVVFQPHRYSRTRDLYQDFIEVLKEVDQLYLVDVYSAGEDPLKEVSSVKLAEEVAQVSKNKPEYVADIDQLPSFLQENLRDKDVVILQGAGSIGAISKQLPLEE